jgi:hypothetical protein
VSVPFPWRDATLLAVALLLGYLLTGSTDLWWFDSGELALVAAQGGVSHPPGQPLYTLVAGFLAWADPLPLRGVALASFLPAAACAFPAYFLVQRLAGPPGSLVGRLLRWLLLLAAGLSWPLWEPATRIEVYALATFLLLGQQAHLAGLLVGRTSELPSRRFLLLNGLLLGLLGCVNLLLACCAGLASLPALAGLLSRGGRGRARRLLSGGAGWIGSVLLGLMPHLQLLWAATRQDGRWIWGDLQTVAGWLHFLRGADYAFGPRLLPPGQWLGQLWELGGHLLLQPPFLLLALGLFPLGRLVLRRPGLLFPLLPAGLLLLVQSANVPLLPDNPDYLGYLAYGGWLLACALAVGLTRAVGPGLLAKGRGLLRLPLAVAILLLLLLAPPRLGSRQRADDTRPRQLATLLLEELPSQALFLVASDHLLFPLLYLQRVEGLRPDVALLPEGLASSSWLFRDLLGHHPDLRPPPPDLPDRETRLREFVAANSHRPLLLELPGMARQLRLDATGASGGLLVHPAPVPATALAGLRPKLRVLLSSGREAPSLDQRVLAFVARTAAGNARLAGDPRWAAQVLAAAAPAGPWDTWSWEEGTLSPAAPLTPPGSCWAALQPPVLGVPFLHDPACLPVDLGYLLWAAGQLAPARAALAAGRDLGCPAAGLVAADLELATGEVRAAHELLDGHLQQFGDHAAVALFRAEARRREGDHASARRLFAEAAAHPVLGAAARQRAAFWEATERR